MRAIKALLAVAFVIVLGMGLPIAGAIAAASLAHVFPALPSGHEATLAWLYSQHFFQTVLALIAIALIRLVFPFDAGLRRPPGKTYYASAILWGLAFGVLMTVVDYAPQLLAHKPPPIGATLAPASVAGWLVFEGIYVGPTEEILFRSLLVGYLMAALPAKLRLGRFEMHWAGVIVAAIFALAHFESFLTRPSFAAAGQQVYAFALGVLYAYWFEKSRSVMAPIVGHNVSDVTEYAICFALMALWA